MKKILVVDDDFSIRESISDILEENGYFVFKAATGKEALEICKKEKLNFAIVDLKLPDISGEKVVNILKKYIDEDKIIIITGFITEEVVEKALRESKFIYLFKPVDPEQLLKILSQGD